MFNFLKPAVMKKLLVALSLTGLAFISAEAQTKTTTTRRVVKTTDSVNYNKNYKVCNNKSKYYVCGTEPATAKTTKTNRTTSVTKTKASSEAANAKNYKICKGSADYHVCDEQPNGKNSVGTIYKSTHKKTVTKNTTTTMVSRNGVVATSATQTNAVQPTMLPQSQSLNGAAHNTLIPYDSTKNDTITNATAPYNGKPSPQDDGPAKNRIRNLNTPPQSPNSIPPTK